MKLTARLVLSLGLFASASAPALATEIDHRAVDCVVAGSFPRLEARFTPADTVGRARVVFRAESGPHWYSVAMQSTEGGFAGVLPKPLESLKRFVYYIEVTDRALETVRTAEYTPAVVAGLGACRDKTVAGALSSATVALEAPVGAPLVPGGFAPSGVVSVAGAPPAGAAGQSGATPASGGAAGSGSGVGTAGATAAGMGAGVKAALIVGAGAAAAAGVAVAAGGGSGDGSDDGDDGGPNGPGPNPSPSPGPAGGAYSITFIPFPPGLDVSACAGRSLNWSSQAVGPPGSALGNFDHVWSPNEPNTMRIAGSVSETSFNATLTCIPGPGTGTIQATGSGGSYQGTFSFGGRGGNVNITRQTN
jgi:hypothetical protein